MSNSRELARSKRHTRIRLKISGTKLRPRLLIKRSLNNIFVQLVDDLENKTLFSGSTQDKDIKQKIARGGNIKSAEVFGELLAKKIKDKGINKIVFDRAGYLYHGRVKAFADALRKGGLEF